MRPWPSTCKGKAPCETFVYPVIKMRVTFR